MGTRAIRRATRMATEGAYRLIRACMTSLEAAEELLKAEPSLISERTGLGETPLHYLAVEDQLEAVRFLHERGASVEIVNEFGESALKEAILLGYLELARYLLQNGANIHTVDQRGESCLHAAVRSGDTQLVKLVLEGGIPVTVVNEVNETPLHAAVGRGPRM